MKLNVENVLGQILLVLLTKTFVRPAPPKSILTEMKQFERFTSDQLGKHAQIVQRIASH